MSPLEAAISLFIQGVFILESLGLSALDFVLRLVYFSIVKKGGARSFLLLLWDRYSPFLTKKYNIEDRLHMEKPRFCTLVQPRSEPCRPFRRDSRG